MNAALRKLTAVLLALALAVSAAALMPAGTGCGTALAMEKIPEFDRVPLVTLGKGKPEFTAKQKRNTKTFERYKKLDKLGRCRGAFANVSRETLPKDERESILNVTPTGWQSSVGYNRCHLIAYQLTAENANRRNIITGTRYLNVVLMRPFEKEITSYVYRTGNHVLYRVTPVFKGDELMARGLQLEAWSVEDGGRGICFNTFLFNIFKRNSKKINYATGEVPGKKLQTIMVGVQEKDFRRGPLKEKATFDLRARSTTGSLVCEKKSGSKRLSVSGDGIVTVRKGTGLGRYAMKVRFTAKGNEKYRKKVTVRTIEVRVRERAFKKKKKTGAAASAASSGEAGKGRAKKSGTVYWTEYGECYHRTKACVSLRRSKSIVSGSLRRAKKLYKRKCYLCY